MHIDDVAKELRTRVTGLTQDGVSNIIITDFREVSPGNYSAYIIFAVENAPDDSNRKDWVVPVLMQRDEKGKVSYKLPGRIVVESLDEAVTELAGYINRNVGNRQKLSA